MLDQKCMALWVYFTIHEKKEEKNHPVFVSPVLLPVYSITLVSNYYFPPIRGVKKDVVEINLFLRKSTIFSINKKCTNAVHPAVHIIFTKEWNTYYVRQKW